MDILRVFRALRVLHARQAETLELIAVTSPIAPIIGHVMWTRNGSSVLITGTHPSGSTRAIVLHGGHCLPSWSGSGMGEAYILTPHGHYADGLDDAHSVTDQPDSQRASSPLSQEQIVSMHVILSRMDVMHVVGPIEDILRHGIAYNDQAAEPPSGIADTRR